MRACSRSFGLWLMTLFGMLALLCPNLAVYTPSFAAPLSAAVGAIALPRGCGSVTPGSGAAPVCCVSGYVWVDGQAVEGASVTISAADGHSLTVLTAYVPESAQPYYRAALSLPPLEVQAGATLTVTARYGGHTASTVFTAESGGQQIDVVLAKQYAADMIFEREIRGQALMGAFNEPAALVVAPSGEIYVADSGNDRVQVLAPDGHVVRQWGQRGQRPGEFRHPAGLAVDGAGNVYVADSWNHRVQKFRSDGTFLHTWGSLGSANGQFRFPLGLAVNADGDVYVADSYNSRVERFSSTGVWQATLGNYGIGDGQLYVPRGVAVDAAGTVFVADTGNARIHRFAPDGQWQSSWGSWGQGNGQFAAPYALAVGGDGAVYVLDPDHQTVQKFSNTGVLQSRWDFASGCCAGEWMEGPKGLGVDVAGNLYVTDTGHHQIKKFSAAWVWLASWGTAGQGGGRINDPRDVAATDAGTVYVLESGDFRLDSWPPDPPYPPLPPGFGFRGGIWQGTGSLPTAQIQVFDSSAGFLRQWALPERGVAGGIVVDHTGSVYVNATVGSTPTHVIYKFSSTGDLLATWGRWAMPTMSWGSSPGSLALDAADNLYVADQSNYRIMKLSSTGDLLASWGSQGSANGQFQSPPGDLAVDSAGIVHVVDYNPNGAGARIQDFNSDDIWQNSVENTLDCTRMRTVHLTADTRGNLLYTSDKPCSSDFLPLPPTGSISQPPTPTPTRGSGGIGGVPEPPTSGGGSGGHAGWLGACVVPPSNDLLWSCGSGGTLRAAWGAAGTADGQLAYPGGIAVAGERVYVADTGNNRIQIFRPMTYTLPIATINTVSSRSLVQGHDTLTLRASASDSDESHDPTKLSYRWYRDNTLLGSTATLTVPATALPVGTYAISLEVTDEEGQVSQRVSTALDVSPPPRAPWTFMLYLVADSALDGNNLLDMLDTGFGNGLLARLRKQAPNAQVQVVVELDGPSYGDTRRMVLEPSGQMRELWRGELPMDDPDTLSNFVRWARQDYPAEHYYLVIAGHGNGYQGTAWDDTSGPNAYLSAAELRRALENASGNGASPIDVLHLDSCSMGLLDVAYELRDQVTYLVASQNLDWGFFLQDRYRAQTGAATTPRQLGEAIVTTYAEYLEQQSRASFSQEQYPYTIALLDLRRATPTVAALDGLARDLGAFAVASSSNRGILAEIRTASQKLDSQEPFVLSNLDEYVDLVDWATRLRDSPVISDPAISTRAADVIRALTGDNPLIVRQRNSAAQFGVAGRLINLSGANGISIYYPHALSPSVATSLWDSYLHDQRFQLTTDSQWDEFLRVGILALPPSSAQLPEPAKPGLAIPKPTFQSFLPLIQR